MPATSDHFSNFATSTVAYGAAGVGTAFKSTDTQLTLKTGDGAKFPSTTPFMVELGGAPFSPELDKCTAINGDTLTLLRAQEGTSAQTWNIGTGVSCVVTAGSLSDLWTRIQAPNFNVRDYGAVGDGITDDTAAINAALAAAQSAGAGEVDLPPGTYKTSATLVITSDNLILRGAGWSTIIKPASGAQFDVISTPIPASAGLSGYTRNYIGIEDLMLDCSNMTGTTAGQGNGIHLYGTRYSSIRRVYVLSCPNWAVLLDGDNTGPGNNFGYDNAITGCVFDLCNAGCYQTNCEANRFTENQFKWAGAATSAAQPALGTQATTAMHLYLSSGYAYVAGNVFGKGGAYTTEAIRCSNSGPCRIIGNRFDQVRNQAVVLNAGNHVFIGNALGSPGSAISGVPGIQLGSNNNRVLGNSFDTTAGGANFTYAVAESGGPFTGNIVADNLLLSGTAGLVSLNASSTTKVHHNAGYNPVGHAVTQPAVPATTVARTNTTGVDCTVFLTGGTVTVVAIGGTSTGLTSGAFRVPAGQTITLTYSVAPTWQWFGD